MAFDFSKLRGRIVEKFGSVAACAQAAGMSDSALYSRLSGRVQFSLDEIYALSAPSCLDIPCAEIGIYFFVTKFDKIEQSEAV